MNGRERVLAMLDGRAVDCLPVMPITMMFAVDQLGKKYFDYATDYHVLADAQVLTAETFDFDHVSAIAETREAPDCGAVVEYYDDQPPSVVESEALLADKAALAGLEIPDSLKGPRMRDRIKGIELLKERAGSEKIVEGWIEGPCAASADLRGINNLMLDFFDDPAFIHEVFGYTLEVGLRFARAQINAGADIMGVGDAAASLLGPKIYEEFVWPYEKKLVDGLHEMGTRVRLHICGNTRSVLKSMWRLGCDIVDLDSAAPLAEARAAMGPEQVLLGNIDPVRDLRDGTPESVSAAVAECHRQAGPRFIAGAGCEVTRDTPAANVHAMVRYAREHKA
jgi:MtaA/CmuA family methyltransferase